VCVWHSRRRLCILCQPVLVCVCVCVRRESDNGRELEYITNITLVVGQINLPPMISALAVKSQLAQPGIPFFCAPRVWHRSMDWHCMAWHGMAWRGGAWTRPGRGRETVGNNCLLLVLFLSLVARLAGLAGAEEDGQQEGWCG
jgi:hypothetical protein